MTRSLCVCLLLIACAGVLHADDKAVLAFNGTDLAGWIEKKPADRSKWKVGAARMDPKHPDRLLFEPGGSSRAAGELVNTEAHSVDLYTEHKFGDCVIDLEVMVPKGSNSGIYVMGEYEVQIFDSYGKAKVGPGDMGGIYATAAPRVNACKKPGEWQRLVIEFQAPRFEGDKKTANGKFLKVVLNGETIHENVEVKGPTPSCLTGRESAAGPVMLQGDHGPVAYRNIKITARK